LEKLFNIPKWKPKNFFSKILGVVYVYILISFTWIFFRAETFDKAIGICKKIFTDLDFSKLNLLDINVFSTIVLALITLLLIEYTIIRKYTFDRIYSMKHGLILSGSFIVFCIVYILIFGNANGSSFIYFQF